MKKQYQRLSLFLALALVLLCSCSGKSPTPPSTTTQPTSSPPPVNVGGGEVTVYTAMPEVELPIYFGVFEKATNIKVNYIRLSAGEVLARLEAEKESPKASVFFGGSTDNFIVAKEKGFIAPYTSTNIDNIPEYYRDPDGYFTPMYISAFCFANNTQWFAKQKLPYPISWQDLLQPALAEQITMAHPSTSGTGYTVLATIVQLMGEDEAFEYIRNFNENVRQYTKLGAAPVNDVGLGEAAVALVFAQDALRAKAEGYPIEVSYPTDGTGYEIGGMALVKDGPANELENAKTFIDWFITKEAQELYDDADAYKMPLNKDAAPPEGVINVSELKTIEYDAVWAGQNRKRLIEKFTKEINDASNLKQ